MKTPAFLTAVLLAFACVAYGQAQNQVFTYPVPEGEKSSPDYSVEINNRLADAFVATVGEPWISPPYNWGPIYSFVQFDFTGIAKLKIHAPDRNMKGVVIRPASLNIKPELIDQNTIAFSIAKPCILSIEPDGRKRALLIFANAPETDPPKKGDPNVLYYGPGIHRPEKGIVEVKSNQTLYVAGGAVLEAAILMNDAENVTIRGRGVISGNRWEWRKGPINWFVSLNNSRNVNIEGIVLRGSFHWTLVPSGCENVNISNVKICNIRVQMNDDGINPCNSRHVRIKNCFIRTVDDCIAVKGLAVERGDVDDIVVENSVLWGDASRVWLFAHESRANFMQNIVSRNIDVVHFGRNPVFLLEPGEDMMLRNVLFENIRINGDGYPASQVVNTEAQQWMAIVRPNITRYNRKYTWGRIENITFKDIDLQGRQGKYYIIVEGVSDLQDPQERRIKNITFDNVRILGERINLDSMRFVYGFWVRPGIDGITFR